MLQKQLHSVLRGGCLLGSPALRPRHGLLAQCATPMNLWEYIW